MSRCPQSMVVAPYFSNVCAVLGAKIEERYKMIGECPGQGYEDGEGPQAEAIR